MSEKIFVTVGSQKFQFNRLLKAVDDLCEKNVIDKDNVFAQIGYSDYCPKYYKFKEFLNADEFDNNMDKCEIVISHGGTGSIIEAIKKGKKIIAVPRLARYKEHVDNHQIQLLKKFEDSNYICVCSDTDNLKQALDTVKKAEYKQYKSNTSVIIEDIRNYIEGPFKHEQR
jgi:UDP-N-acetylglucosamine transferase subunit ALG13